MHSPPPRPRPQECNQRIAMISIVDGNVIDSMLTTKSKYVSYCCYIVSYHTCTEYQYHTRSILLIMTIRVSCSLQLSSNDPTHHHRQRQNTSEQEQSLRTSTVAGGITRTNIWLRQHSDCPTIINLNRGRHRRACVDVRLGLEDTAFSTKFDLEA